MEISVKMVKELRDATGAGVLDAKKALVETSGDREEIIYAEVSLAEARQKQLVFKPGEFELNFIRDRRPELYGEITKQV